MGNDMDRRGVRKRGLGLLLVELRVWSIVA